MLVDKVIPVAEDRLSTVADTAPLIDAAKLLHGADTNLVVVCNGDGAMVGVITKTDVVARISHCEGASCTTAAASVMSRDVISCRPGDRLHEVWSVMRGHGLKHIPVIGRDNRPIGILGARDVVQALLDEVQNEELLLRDYVMRIGYQ